MRYYAKKISIITVEVTCMNTEQTLNGLWKSGIKVNKIKRIDAVTLNMDIYGDDYEDLKTIVKRCNGKTKILKRKGKIINISKLKRKITFTIGGVLFFFILFILSTRIWAIDIYTEKNVTPFEIRKILNEFGIKQGIGKSEVDVYSLEKKLEDIHDEILWVRARIEGSTLKVKIEEKVNPPDFLEIYNKEILAKKDGEVKRVYTQFGTAAVNPGDMVKKGDVLIYPYDGLLEEKYEVEPKGSVIANVFYERSLEVQIKGKKLEKTGREDKDLYLNLWGKKIYLKKATNSFENYDKIVDNTGFVKSITYCEMAEGEINLDEDSVVNDSLNKLENLLLKDLSNEAKIIKRNHKVKSIKDGKIQIIAQFVVEENIA